MEPEKIQFSYFRAIKPIGKGAVGEVFLAEDTQKKRQVAAKLIRLETLQATRELNVNILRQFLRDVGASAALKHPNILPVGEHGEATLDGSPGVYVTMPYHSEGSLHAWLSQQSQKQPGWRPTPRQVVHITRLVSTALQHAHEHKIAHLDLKPTNILVQSRSSIDEYPDLLLSDFGTATLLNTPLKGDQKGHERSAYLAPEQKDNKGEMASDQYALAAITYELLTGHPPVRDAANQEQLKPASASLPQLPPEADQALQRALALKPADRFPSVSAFTQAFQTALQRLTAGEQPKERPATPPAGKAASAEPSSKKGDIRATLSISAEEARNGVVRTLSLPNGQKVEVQIPPGSQPEQIIVLNGKGDVPAPGSRPGDLYLRLSLPKIPAVSASVRGAKEGTPGISPAPAGAPSPVATPGPQTPPQNKPVEIAPLPPLPVDAPRPLTPPQGTAQPPAPPVLPIPSRPNGAQGPASIAPMPPEPGMSPRPNAAQGPASIAPMPPEPGMSPRPNVAQGPASIAPLPPEPGMPPRPNAAQGPASMMPLPASPMPPQGPGGPAPAAIANARPNVAQGPASIAPMPPSPMAPPQPNMPPQGPGRPGGPMATPRPNMAQGPASITPLPPPMTPPPGPGGPMVTPRSQGPASMAPMPPSPMVTPRSQGPASMAPMPPEPRAPEAAPTRANSRAAVLTMMVLLLLAIGISAYGALSSNTALLQNILYGQASPTASSSTQFTPTVPPKLGPSPWHAQPSGTTQGLISVTWADTRFVAVGEQGTILTSPNGTTWFPQHSGTTQTLQSVVWSGGLLVAVGSGGTILSSPDGVLWTVQHSGTTQTLWSVGWVDGSIFVAVGSGGTILTSRDGKTWAAQVASSGQILDGVAWSGSLLVVVGSGGTVITSNDDGTTWATQDSGTQQLLQSVNWVNTQFIAVGTNGTILTSAKGSIWVAQKSNVTQNLTNSGWNGAQYVVVGDNGTILTSAKGTSWTQQASSTTQPLESLARSTTTFAATVTTPIPLTPVSVAVGKHGTILLQP